jgi:hypothetical protein
MNDSSNDNRSPAASRKRVETRAVTAGRGPDSYRGVEDLIADLEQGFAALAAASR